VLAGLDLTVEVEAKAKEVAVLRLMSDLQGTPLGGDGPTINREDPP
jgi:UV DNA damage repair endonuclease